MENIERTQFVVLTGHLDEQPLPDLIRRLRAQRKSGRLRVEYPEAPGAFFFEDGQLVDAQLGSLRGVEALYAALSLGGASFNFNPLVRPPERNIDRQGQQFIWDLIEAPRRGGLAEIDAADEPLDLPAAPTLPRHVPRQLPPAAAELVAPLEERLTAVEEAIINTSRRFSRERLLYAVIISFLAGLSLVATLNLIYDPFRPAPAAAALPEPRPAAPDNTAGAEAARASSAVAAGQGQEGAGPAARERGTPSAASSFRPQAEPAAGQARPAGTFGAAAARNTRRAGGRPPARGEQEVQVLVKVENGQVTDARVWDPQPGADAYESDALRLARERRYLNGFTGSERLTIKVKP